MMKNSFCCYCLYFVETSFCNVY